MDRVYASRWLAALACDAAAEYLTVDGFEAPVAELLREGANVLQPERIELAELPGAFELVEPDLPVAETYQAPPDVAAGGAPAESVCMTCGVEARREWAFCPSCGGSTFLEKLEDDHV